MTDETLDQELSALLDGELAPEHEASLRERIASEPELAARFAELAALNESLRAMPAPAMPADLRARLQERIDAETVSRPTRFRIGAPLAAALAAGLVAAWLLLPGSQPDESMIAAERQSPPAVDLELPDPTLEEASDDELEIALELETLQDLDLIQDLDLLEALMAMEDADAPTDDNNERG